MRHIEITQSHRVPRPFNQRTDTQLLTSKQNPIHLILTLPSSNIRLCDIYTLTH